MDTPANKTGSILKKLPEYVNYISSAALALLMLLVTLNVILRAVFKSPIMCVYDFTGFLTIIIIGFGLAYCSVKDGHIEITILTDKMPKFIGKAITASGRMISFIILSVTSYALFKLGSRYMQANELSVTTQTPLGIFAYALSFCFMFLSLTVLIKALGIGKAGDEK